LPNVKYLYAKNAPMVKPEREESMNITEPKTNPISIASAPEAIHAIMNKRACIFVAAKSPNVTGDGISRFLS
jgi:hypothetical protein